MAGSAFLLPLILSFVMNVTNGLQMQTISAAILVLSIAGLFALVMEWNLGSSCPTKHSPARPTDVFTSVKKSYEPLRIVSVCYVW